MSEVHNSEDSLGIDFEKKIKKNSKIAKIEGCVAVGGNVVLGIFKLWVGNVTGSLAVIADAWETLSDSLSSIVLLIGLKISEKPADAEHPFGHGRAELISSVVIAMMLAAVGFGFTKGGIEKIIDGERLEFGWLAMSAMIATIVFKETMAQYAFWTARKTKLNSLRADGYHHRSDAISSAVVLVGMIVAKIGGDTFWWMDGALSSVVGLFLLRIAYIVLRDAGNKLLGTRIPEETEKKISEICVRITGYDNLDIHHLHYHEYGTHNEVSFHIRLDGNTTLTTAHTYADKIEKTIMRELNIDATIHFEPHKKKSAGGPQIHR